MRIFRLAGLAVGLVMFLMLVGCGETYRPVVNPFPSPGGDPQISNTILVLNQGVKADPNNLGQVLPCQATDTCPGSVSQLDVPGDANMMNRTIGEDPVGIFSLGFLYVANRGNNTVSSFFTASSTVTSIPLPDSVDALVDATNKVPINVTGPSFIAPSFGTQFLVTMPACSTAPAPAGVCTTPDTANPGVLAAVAFTSGSVQAYRVGNYPIAVVEPLNRSRIYVLNYSSSSVDVFAGLDNKRLATVTGDSSNGISSPVFGLAKPDSSYVFVLNRGNAGLNMDSRLTVFATFNDSIPFSPTLGAGGSSTPPEAPLNNPMFYDTAKQWLWVTNPNDDSVTVFDASKLNASTPDFTTVRRISRCADSTSTNCFPKDTAPISVTALADGTRAFVVGAGVGGVKPSVYMIDTTSFAVTPVSGYNGTSPRGIISSPDSTKVYVINHDPTTVPNTNSAAPAGSVVTTQQPGTNVISTSNNSFLKDNTGNPLTIPAPFQDPLNCQLDTPEPWAPSQAYGVNAAVMPAPSNGHVYQATNAGKSASSPPTFCTTSNCTVTDGTIIWKEIGQITSDTMTHFNCPRQRPSLVALP